jgi:hypothetical protein
LLNEFPKEHKKVEDLEGIVTSLAATVKEQAAQIQKVSAQLEAKIRVANGFEQSLDTASMKYWEIIADNLSQAGWSLGWVSAVDCRGRTIWIADAHRDDGRRSIVHADEMLTAFVELESAILQTRKRQSRLH